jgi:hypothetical protein
VRRSDRERFCQSYSPKAVGALFSARLATHFLHLERCSREKVHLCPFDVLVDLEVTEEAEMESECCRLAAQSKKQLRCSARCISLYRYEAARALLLARDKL